MKTETPRTDKKCLGTLILQGDADFARQLERELNKWRDCATRLAACTVKAVPLVCLDLEEKAAMTMFDNLNSRRRNA